MSDETEPETGTDGVEPAAEPTDDTTADLVHGCVVTWSRGQKVIHVERSRWLEVARALVADGWNMCVDITAVDYLTYEADRGLPEGVQPERFEVVASFVSHSRRERLRARTQVPASDPTIESLYAVYPGTDYLEREAFDLVGITFDGHPDLSRILMPETWEGHPLRKDYAIGAIPVQFKSPTH